MQRPTFITYSIGYNDLCSGDTESFPEGFTSSTDQLAYTKGRLDAMAYLESISMLIPEPPDDYFCAKCGWPNQLHGEHCITDED
jgi:hypothetical protein